MDEHLDPQLKKIFVQRQTRRKELARQSFPEEIRMLVKMQKMAALLERRRGKRARIWKIGA